MNRGIYTATSGALAALARLDAAAQNLANINTAGYKAERPQFRLYEEEAVPRSGLAGVQDRTGGAVVEID